MPLNKSFWHHNINDP